MTRRRPLSTTLPFCMAHQAVDCCTVGEVMLKFTAVGGAGGLACFEGGEGGSRGGGGGGVKSANPDKP